ncbi:XRE family transcriptional regulator [Phreatobacter stygius]|nr:S24 family peptidase [Phreatobacter stygius]
MASRLLANRLRRAIAAAGGPRRVARATGVSERTLQLYLASKADPKIGKLAVIAQACGVSLDWLAGLSERAAPAGAAPDEAGIGIEADPDTVQLAILNVAAAAGPGRWNERAEIVGRLPFSFDKLRRHGVDPARAHAIRAAGDSMWPTIADQALVLVDTGRRDIVEDAIYAFVVDDQARIKRIQRGLDGSLIFISDNAALYGPDRLARDRLDQLEVVGRVFWSERLF